MRVALIRVAAAAAVAAAVVAVGASSGTAQADCPAGHVCVWSEGSFQGDRHDLGPGYFDGECVAHTFQSVKNHTADRTVYAYQNGDCHATYGTTVLRPGEELPGGDFDSLSIG